MIVKRLLLFVLAVSLLTIFTVYWKYSSQTNLQFMIAVERGDTNTVQALLKKGVNANTKNRWGSSALTQAVYLGRTKVVELLVANGANINVPIDKNITVLTLAAGKGYADIVKILLDNGAKIDNNSFHAAVSSGNELIVQELLDKGADINSIGRLHMSALMYAAQFGRTNVVKYLLAKGADVNLKVNGETALIIAKKNKHPDIVKLLQQAGAKE